MKTRITSALTERTTDQTLARSVAEKAMHLHEHTQHRRDLDRQFNGDGRPGNSPNHPSH